jgi:hypothetical protein
MSPTIFVAGGLRFLFFSREEARIHVHVHADSGTAKVWLEPAIRLAWNDGLGPEELDTALRLVEERQDEIFDAWWRQFGR